MSRGSRFRGRLLAALLSFGALASVAPAARADAASEAQLQFELGSELYKQGRYVEAIDRFVASNRLAPNPNVVLNVARTFTFLKRPVDAYNWYSTYLAFDLPSDKRADAEAAQLALLPDVAVLEVTTTPSGAEIFVDRPELGSQGRSPRRIAVEAGAHLVLARLAGHHPGETRVDAARGGVSAAPLSLAPVVGTLELHSTPSGARVALDATHADLGRTPLSVSLPVGEVRLTLSAPGYVEQAKTFRIEDGATSRVEVRLAREASRVAVLSVTGDVPRAEVTVDGVLVGLTPVTVPDLAPGTRRVTVRRAGYERWEAAVLFEPGAATRVRYSLVDPRDRPWPGYRWLGYGVAAALGATGTVTGIMALGANADLKSDPTRDGLERRDRLNVTTDVLLLSALVVAGGTLVWDLFTPNRQSSAEVTLSR